MHLKQTWIFNECILFSNPRCVFRGLPVRPCTKYPTNSKCDRVGAWATRSLKCVIVLLASCLKKDSLQAHNENESKSLIGGYSKTYTKKSELEGMSEWAKLSRGVRVEPFGTSNREVSSVFVFFYLKLCFFLFFVFLIFRFASEKLLFFSKSILGSFTTFQGKWANLPMRI